MPQLDILPELLVGLHFYRGGESNFKQKKKKEDRLENTNVRSELGMYEIKNDIQKRKLRWFGYMMWKPKNFLHTKMEGKQ